MAAGADVLVIQSMPNNQDVQNYILRVSPQSVATTALVTDPAAGSWDTLIGNNAGLGFLMARDNVTGNAYRIVVARATADVAVL